jgi:hypothetical protein
MDNISVKFQGFHPSNFTRSYLSDKLSAVYDEAPYGSTLKATFTRRDHVFKGVVTIYSSAGKFFAVASGNKLKEVTHKLTEQLRRQLDRWRSKRFRHESIKDVAFSDNNNQTEEVDYDTSGVA